MVRQFYKYVSRNVAGMVGISIYVIADTFFISLASGTDGIALLNLALPLYGLIFAIGSLIGIGSATRFAILNAQENGEKDFCFTQAILWQMLLSVPFVLLGIFAPEWWIYLMGGDSSLAQLGGVYVRIVMFGTPFFMMNYTFSGFARNDNAPTVAMLSALLASGFNILFDYIFMFPMGMGIAGAALATAMAPVVSIAVCCVHFFSERSTVKLVKVRMSLAKLIKGCKLGVSAFVGEISSAITATVFNFLLLSMAGNTGVAAYGIVANFSLVAMAIFNGIAQGMQPLLSDCYGRAKHRELTQLLRMGIVVAVIVELLMIMLAWLFTDNLVDIFNSENSNLLEKYAFDAIRLYFLGFIFSGANIIIISYFSSVGDAVKASVTSLLRGVFAVTVSAVVMSMLFGIIGIWLSFLTGELITFIVVVALYFSNKRKYKRNNSAKASDVLT